MLDLDMGKYALFVWPAFAITAVIFAAMIYGSLAHSRRWRKRAQELDRRRK